MTISINTFKEDLMNNFKTYGADKGFNKNASDICQWFKDGFLTEEEYYELRHYNRIEFSKLPLDD